MRRQLHIQCIGGHTGRVELGGDDSASICLAAAKKATKLVASRMVGQIKLLAKSIEQQRSQETRRHEG